MQYDVVYLDFSKAFDTVPHDELLLKLWCMGVCGDLWLWFRVYLNNRLQCVSLGNIHSDLVPVISGVPQGSDLPDYVLKSSLAMFADDVKCAGKIVAVASDQALL